MNEPILTVDSVGKIFNLGGPGSYNTLTSTLLTKLKREKQKIETKAALENVSFEVSKGDIVGLIGKNGSGKSTLLRVIAGITKPTSGNVKLNGSIAAILEVGAGFHPEMTGRENARLNGAILGLKASVVDARMEEIIDFAELQDSIDLPLKKYSSGMRSRLGFAVASLLNPDLLIVDEALAVGDIAFQQRSLGKMETMAESGRAVIFVSHQASHVRSLCNRAIWLEGGNLKMDSDVSDTLSSYQMQMLDTHSTSQQFEEYRKTPNLHDSTFTLMDYSIEQGGITVTTHFDPSSELIFNIVASVNESVPGLRIFIDCQDSYGGLVFRTFSDENKEFEVSPAIGVYNFRVKVPGGLLALTDYIFSIEATIHNNRRVLPAHHFSIALNGLGISRTNPAYSGDEQKGIMMPDISWEITRK
jgi:lipopolysaccharide transport system ATP-binding protein